MITYDQIVAGRLQDAILAEYVQSLRGVSPVVQTGADGGGLGAGFGAVVASGTARTSAQVVVRIVTGGEPGVATYQISLDGGTTWGDVMTVPLTAAAIAVGSSGAYLSFTPSASASDASFVSGDRYSFTITLPVWDATAWQQFTPSRRLIDLATRGAYYEEQSIAAITRGGFLLDAEGPWLDLVARNFYDEDRRAPIFARGYVVLTCDSTAGPYTISPGQVWLTDGTVRFNNLSGGTLATSGTLVVLVQAESPGTAWNVGQGAIDTLITSLPGVTVTNGSWVSTATKSRAAAPTITGSIVSTLAGDYDVILEITSTGVLGVGGYRISTDNGKTWVSSLTLPSGGTYDIPGTGLRLTLAAGTYTLGDTYSLIASYSWLSVSGTDRELDESLRARCMAKWAELSQPPEAPGAAYENWAKDANEEITRALAVASTTEGGHINLYVASASGAPTAPALSDVEDYVEPRAGLTTVVDVQAAEEVDVALTGTVYVAAGSRAAAQAAAEAALAEYQATAPIGGAKLGPTGTGVSREILIGLLTKGSPAHPVSGVVDVTLSTPAADTTLVVPQVPVIDPTGLLWVEV